jgi:peptide chain release factor 2
VIKRFKALKTPLERYQKILKENEELQLLLELAQEESDKETLLEVENQTQHLDQEVGQLEIATLLAGEHDFRNCYFQIQAGTGGTDADDFAELLMRMYLYYFEKMGWKAELLDQLPGEEAGLKSVSFKVIGEYAYGKLSAERGVHRMARVSPYNAQGKRQTSFASVQVIPEFENVDMDIEESDIEVVTYAKSAGPGGQNVNKVATAVRITHIPSGLVVACSTERSQLSNRKNALEMLQAKLFQLEEAKRDAALANEIGEKGEISWGNQIRSYVLYDRRVKDHRTGYEVMNPEVVLNGAIEGFITTFLQQRASKKNQQLV